MRSSVLDSNRSPEVELRDPELRNVRYPNPGNQPPFQPQRFRPPYQRPPAPAPQPPQRRLKLAPAEGWFALILLAVALYSVVFSIIFADWVGQSFLLLWPPVMGLLVGFLVAKIPRFPQAILHLTACLAGYWFSVWLTSSVAFHIQWIQLLGDLRTAFTGGLTASALPTGEVVFFFYLSFLTYFLGYFGSWLIYRARLPWLVALVYSSILLVNLNYLTDQYYYLSLILLGALLLLIARIHLAAQILQWKREGLYTDRTWMRNMTWRCMQIASALTLIVVGASWVLPMQNQSTSGKNIWDHIDNTWTNLVNGHVSLQNPGEIFQPYQAPTNFFSDQLTITGSVHLPTGQVLSYSSSDGPHYLEGFTYDHFDGHTWTTSLTSSYAHAFDAGAMLPADNVGNTSAQITTTVTFTVPPQGTKPYLFAPAQPITFDVPTVVYNDGTAADWTQQNPLTNGERYHVTSLVPPSDPQTLASIPLPAANPDLWRADSYDAQLVLYYEQLPQDLSPNVLKLAHQWTQGATDTYSALKMLEAHLSDQQNFTYSINNPPIPPNVDVVDWLLQTHVGYCTYYASAMAVMARQLGIPTRVVNGFSRGHYDSRHKVWAVDGTDAHSWVQAYFPGYGWISFDPTPGYAMDTATNQRHTPVPPVTKNPTKPVSKATPPAKKPTPVPARPQIGADPTGSTGGLMINQGMLMAVSILALLISLLVFLFALVSYWWRNLYANSTLVAGTFWRLCRIASWAGLAPRAWQTPYEYSQMLIQHFPQKATSLWHLTELFVRDRWGSPHHVPRAREEAVAEQLWPSLRGSLLRLLLRKIRK